MDLQPPPPPPPPLRRNPHHNLRYGNALHPPDFPPAPYGTHLPPPHLRSPNFFPPPPPPPPHTVRYVAQRPRSPPFSFIPPNGPIRGRSDPYEFDPPPKPYFDRIDYLPPPPPFTPRESIPLRSIHDYPERNPMFKGAVLDRGFVDSYIREMHGNSVPNVYGGQMDVHSSVLDVEGREEGYRNSFYRSNEMRNRRDDDMRSWDYGIDLNPELNIRRDSNGRRWDWHINGRSPRFHSEMDYDERRWSSGIFEDGRRMPNERDSDGWRWNDDITNRGRARGNEWVYDERWNNDTVSGNRTIGNGKDYDERRWNSDIIDRGCGLGNGMDFVVKKRDYGVHDRGCELYSEGNADGGRLDYVVTNGARSKKVENRQPECSEDDLNWSRFSRRLASRLARDVKKGEFNRSKKRRLQKKNTSHRTQPGSACSWHSKGYKCQHHSKQLGHHSFRGKEKQVSEQWQAEMEDKGEREWSPVDLAISFKSNALVARAIVAPPFPDVKSNFNSVDADNGKVDNIPESSFTESDKDTVKENGLARGLDILSDQPQLSKEFPDKVEVSVSISVPADKANDLGVISTKNEDLANIRRPNVAGPFCNNQTALPELNTDAAISEESTPAFIVTDSTTVLLPSLGGIISKKGDLNGDSCEPIVSNLKRKRSSLNVLTASSQETDGLVTETSCHEESFLTNSEHSYCECRLSSNGFACHNAGTGHGDDTDFNEHDNNLVNVVRIWSASVDGEKRAIESFSNYCSDRVDDVCESYHKDGLVVLENDFIRGTSEVKASVEGHDMVGSTKNQESKISEFHVDERYSIGHESISCSESDSSLPQKPENDTMSGKGSTFTNSRKISAAQFQVGVDALEEFRHADDTAGADSSDDSLDISLSSKFLSVSHMDNTDQFHVSSIDAVKTESSTDVAGQLHRSGTVEGSSEAIIHVKSRTSPKIGKRKAMVAQIGNPNSKTKVIGTFESIGSDIARCLAKNLVPAAGVGFLEEKSYSGENASLEKRPPGIQDSIPVDDNGSFHAHKKTRGAASPRSKLSSLSDDDIVVDGFARDGSMVGQGSIELVEWRTKQSEVTLSASAATNKCGLMDVEGKIGSESFNIAGSDVTLPDGNNLQVDDDDDDLIIIADNLSPFAGTNGFCPSNSGNELLASGFHMRSCRSSPEVIPSYSDIRLSRNRAVPLNQSENGMISQREVASNREPVPTGRKSLEKATSYNLPIKTKNAAPLTTLSSKVGENVYRLQGKPISGKNQLSSTAPRVFPGHQPAHQGNSRVFNSAHATKSRTWHRTGNPAGAVFEPKVKPAPLPQAHGAKAKPVPVPQVHEAQTARAIQSSYIRKGNSLVRKASQSNVTTSGFPVSGSSVYRLTPCTDNFKNTRASNGKIGISDAPTQLRSELVNMSETAKELPLKHNWKSINCTSGILGESLLLTNVASNNFPSKASDSLEETARSSPIAEFQAGSVTNTGSQMTLNEENSRKKITYVKRSSNQLVASSSSDDISKLAAMDKPLVLSSNGYVKNKKYQLVRASSQEHEIKRDVDVNSCSLDSHTILRRTSSRRQPGFAKGYRSSKFSLVWKLHDTHSPEKRKKVAGPRKVWPQLFTWKKATQRRSFMHALGTKINGSSFTTSSSKYFLSRRRGAIYKRSTHGYSLRISKVLSVSGASLKWSKSIERNSKKANEEATKAVAAAEKRKKEGKRAARAASKARNHVSRDRVFRIGSERYRMDSTRRTLQRITDEKESSSAIPRDKNAKRSYVPRRLLIGNEEYVRIGNGNQLVRNPKRRNRVLASEKVRWSLRTARMRLARKRKYCQFFTRFGKCNKDDGKCPYIHDPSKIAVCTKFLSGSCVNTDCKLTHEIIPERMQDCSYFLKGSCSNENCPYRHVNVNPDSSVCEGFLRGYCADGNECMKKHTYVCPVYESTGTCPQALTCKLHHPKKKMEKKPTNEQKIVRGRYFDGGLVADPSIEELFTKGKEDVAWPEGKFPDYISLEFSDEEMDHPPTLEQECDDTQMNLRIGDDPDELNLDCSSGCLHLEARKRGLSN